jgi:hypothetical protein
MTSRERMDRAMRPRAGVLPDRVPVMCQLALGHYFLQAGLDPVDIWHDSQVFGDALIRLQRRYGFDGVLVNLPGRNPDWRRHVRQIEAQGRDRVIAWEDGCRTVVPPDDNPHVFPAAGASRTRVAWGDIDPDRLYYLEPHGLVGPTAVAGGGWPAWQHDTLRYVRAQAPDVSVHGEVFSPFSQLLEWVDHAAVLMALIEDPGRVRACLDRLSEGAINLAVGQADAGADAILMSSAFAGGGFISPRQYRAFVLPCERAVIAGIRTAKPELRVYTHTCGAIGDRLELIEETGTDGIDTLDPPPLGTVDLAEAKQRLGRRLFIKGNLDPVGTLLNGAPDACYGAALERLAIAKPDGGYILSSACSVAPHTPPANIAQLRRAVDAAGSY